MPRKGNHINYMLLTQGDTSE